MVTSAPPRPLAPAPPPLRHGRLRRLQLAVLPPCLAGVIVGLAVTWAMGHERTALMAALILVIPAPLVVRAVQRRFDPFEPITIFAIGLAVLFIGRPIAELQYGLTTYGRYMTRDGFNGALLIGLVGSIALYAGYFLPAARRMARRLPPLSERWDTARAVRFAGWLLLFAAIMFGVFALAAGGLGATLSLFSGRDGVVDGAATRATTGWIWIGPYVIIPASLILLAARSRRRTPGTTILLVIAVLGSLALTVPRGDRTFILTFLLPFVALPYLRRQTRPRVVTVIVALVLAVVAINVLLVQRDKNTRTNPVDAAVTALTTPGKQFEKLMTGPDPSEFSVLAIEYQIMPKDLSFSPGVTPLSIIAGPVPGPWWSGKPEPALQRLTNYLFYQESLINRSSFGPPSLGDMYGDAGFVTVFLYALIAGLVVRTLYEYFRAHERNVSAQLVYAAALPLMIIFLRNAVADTLWHSLALVGPLLLCVWVCSRPRGAVLPRLRPGAWAGVVSRVR